MSWTEQKEMMATLTVSLASGTVGLAQYLKDQDLWMAILVALVCSVVGGYGKGAGSAMWVKTTHWWIARKRAKTTKQ